MYQDWKWTRWPLGRPYVILDMLPAMEETDNQMDNDGHTFSSFQPHVSVLSDVGRNAQGREPAS